MKPESWQKQSESALSLHLVSCSQVLRQLGRTPGADGEGAAGAEEGAIEEAGAEEAGCWGEGGAVAGADAAGGGPPVVPAVAMDVLMMVDTL